MGDEVILHGLLTSLLVVFMSNEWWG